jgi:cytochrome c biogenesis protein CcmG/thiol:disulfide interchange protein DsbE
MVYMSDQETPKTSEPLRSRDISTAISAVVGLALLALLTFAFLSSDRGRLQQGDLAPDFSLTLFDGSEVSLNDLRGQVVVLNFWASWCAPCRREAPALQETWETYKGKGVIFLGVTYKDAKKASQEFITEFGITYSNGIDARGQISRAFGVVAVPETFIIDSDGKVAWFRIGEIQAQDLVEQLEQLQNK